MAQTARDSRQADRYQSIISVLRWLAHARGEIPPLAPKGPLWRMSSAASSPLRGSVWMAGMTSTRRKGSRWR